MAVDLPSGIDADTGAVDGPAVRADVTVTFGAIKPGLLIDPGAGHAGVVELVDIGLGPYLDGRPDGERAAGADIAALLPRPARGVGQVPARRARRCWRAATRFTGAALLSTGGAVHGGAGMVRLVTCAGRGGGRAAGPARGGDHGAVRETARDPLRTKTISSPATWAGCRRGSPGSGMGTDDAAAGRLGGGARPPACRCWSTRTG